MINRVFCAVVAIVFMIYIFTQVKKKKFSEKESFFWMMGGVIVIVLGFFPQIVDSIAGALNIKYPPALIFMLGIVFSLGLIFRVMIYISLLKEQNKELAQKYAILEKRVADIEINVAK